SARATAQSIVADMPWRGDAVTVTVAWAGRCSGTSSAMPGSGSTSKRGGPGRPTGCRVSGRWWVVGRVRIVGSSGLRGCCSAGSAGGRSGGPGGLGPAACADEGTDVLLGLVLLRVDERLGHHHGLHLGGPGVHHELGAQLTEFDGHHRVADVLLQPR